MQIEEGKVYILSDSLELTDIAHKFFASNLQDNPPVVLTNTLKVSRAEQIAALFYINGVIYLAARGGAGIKIIRNNVSTTLIRSGVIKSVNVNVTTASGFPKEKDKMVLQLANGDQNILELDFITPKTKHALFPKVKSLITNFSSRLPKKPIYIKPELVEEVSPQSKKLTFSIAVILLVLLAVSIGFGIRQKKINDVKGKYESILGQAQNEVDQAISLASISSEKSRQLFADAEQKIALMDTLKVKDSGLTTLKQKINESRGAILGEYLVTPQMFLDLSLLSSGFKGNTLAFSGGQIYVMDSEGRRVVSVDSASKKSKVIAGPTIVNSALGLACYEDRVFVLQADGIYEVESRSQKVIDKTWSGEALIAAFAGNLYVVDKDGGSIYRYQGTSNTFGEKQNWLSPGTNIAFTNVKQITIDGSIYALYPNSKIIKFSQGSPQNFNITGTIPEIGTIDAISASPDNQNVYVLDTAGNRVVVVDKKGVYKAQYVDSGISQATGLVVSEADKKIILLTGDKLYSVDIKN